MRVSAGTHAIYNVHVWLTIVYLSAASVTLGMGLKRHYSWAWDGTVYGCGMVALVGVCTPILTLNIMTHPRPAAVRDLSILGAVILLPAVLLLSYLFRAHVRSAFEPVVGTEERKPTLWIRLVAVANIMASGISILDVFNTRAYPVLGVLSGRLWIDANAVLNGAVMIYIGLGLYKLRESARRVAIGSGFYGFVSILLWLFVFPTPSHRFTLFRIASTAFFAGLIVVTIAYLHRRRKLFTELR